MMLTKITAAGLALVVTAATAVTAQQGQTPPEPNYIPQDSGQLLDLIEDCDDDSCMSYVAGAIGGMTLYSVAVDRAAPYCAPENIQIEEIRDAVASTISSTPALEDQHPAFSILAAFSQHWPCEAQRVAAALRSVDHAPIDPGTLAAAMEIMTSSLVLGPADADRSISVFHDPNCAHCLRFSDELDLLAEDGWRVTVYPVATTHEDSAGYGAVEIALKDISAEAVRALHDYRPEGIADIAVATDLARDAGVSDRDVLTAIARSGAYQSIEDNTRAFFSLGAEGTPSWILGDTLYSGVLEAVDIQAIARASEPQTAAPSPDQDAQPTETEE